MARGREPGLHPMLLACALAAAAVLAGGCGTEARYRTLTFFFTGVPPPGEEHAASKIPAPSGERAASKEAAAPGARRVRRDFVQEPAFFAHGPFGAAQCDRCHAVAASKPFRAVSAEPAKPADAAPARRSIGPRLATPLRELCLTCHADKAHASAEAQGLWMHGPVANGLCVACHSPHRAAREYMLLGKNNVEMCTGCHRKPDLARTVAHQKDPEADCLACHNPHQGRSASLLKTEHDEWRAYGKGG